MAGIYDPMSFVYEEFGDSKQKKKKGKSAKSEMTSDPTGVMKMTGDLLGAALAVNLGIFAVNQTSNLVKDLSDSGS